MKVQPFLIYQNTFKRLKSDVLNPSSGEADLPEGHLVASNGKKAYFKFWSLDKNSLNTFSEDFSLGNKFKGEGIYLLDFYKENDDVPFWILVNENELTLERTNEILSTIEQILGEDRNLNKSDYWNLDGKKPQPKFNPMSRFNSAHFYQSYWTLKFSNIDPRLN